MKIIITSFYLSILILLAGLNTFAEVGRPEIISDQGPASICRIIFSDKIGVSFCSGNLVESDKILTAAHCFDNKKNDVKISIECGYRGFEKENLVEVRTKSGNRLYSKGVRFAEAAEGISFQLHPQWPHDEFNYDTAVIILNKKMQTQPMKIGFELSDLSEQTECFSAGYGLNKNATMGFLNVAKIDQEQLFKSNFVSTEEKFVVTVTDPNEEDDDALEDSTMLRFAEAASFKYSIISHGDSGGPVFCRNKPDGEFRQVGINRAMYFFRKQRRNSKSIDIDYTSAYSKPDIGFIKK